MMRAMYYFEHNKETGRVESIHLVAANTLYAIRQGRPVQLIEYGSRTTWICFPGFKPKEVRLDSWDAFEFRRLHERGSYTNTMPGKIVEIDVASVNDAIEVILATPGASFKNGIAKNG